MKPVSTSGFRPDVSAPPGEPFPRFAARNRYRPRETRQQLGNNSVKKLGKNEPVGRKRRAAGRGRKRRPAAGRRQTPATADWSNWSPTAAARSVRFG